MILPDELSCICFQNVADMSPRHVRFANLAATAVLSLTFFGSVMKAAMSATQNPYRRNSYGTISVAGKHATLRNQVRRFDSGSVRTHCEAPLWSSHLDVAMHKCETYTFVRLLQG